MNTETLSQSWFDAYAGDGPIGGACSIWLHGSIRLLTAFHISHDTKRHNSPRPLIFRNRTGDVTLRNIAFAKVSGSRDLSLSEPLDLDCALSVATQYVPGNEYITLGSVVSLLPNRNRVLSVPDEIPVPLRKAPRHVYIKSLGQKVDFGFSGKPVIDADTNVAGVIVAKQRFISGWYGVAEMLRQRVFHK